MALSEKQRELIAAEARTWFGTPYCCWSCLKGVGTDCGQLIYGVYRSLGLLPVIDIPKDYSVQIGIHQPTTDFHDRVAEYFREVPESEVRPGDVVLYRFALAYCHAAIVIKWPDFIIHAVARHGVSGEHGIKNPLCRRWPRSPLKFYTLKDDFC